MDILLALVVILAVPVNVALSRRIRRVAGIQPRLLLLDVLAFLVTMLAALTGAVAILAIHSVVFALTGVRIIPSPGATLLIVVILLALTYANVVVWWRTRPRTGGIR